MSSLFGGGPAPTQQQPQTSIIAPRPPLDPAASLFGGLPHDRPKPGGLFAASAQLDRVHDSRKSAAFSDIDAKDSIVTVRVGEPFVAFSVHRSVLLRSSRFLQTKAKPEWSKGEAIVDLSHHQPTAFDLYSKWLYSDCIISRRQAFGLFTQPTEASEDTEWALPAHAFVLGEALIDNKFKNTILDALRAKAQKDDESTFWPVASSIVHIIYEGTPQSSQARKFIVDIFHNHGDAKALDSEDGFPADFLLEIARTSLSRRTEMPMANPGAEYTARCLYHDHGEEGSVCYPAGSLFGGIGKS